MRHTSSFTLLCLSALVAACGSDPQRPDELQVGDTLQTRGTLLTSGEALASRSHLAWVPGTDLVAFTSSSPTGDCAIKTVDAANGATSVLDGDCASTYAFDHPYYRRLVAAPDGSALYYTVGLDESAGSSSEFALRVADPMGGGTSTLRSVGWHTVLAVSPDSRHLAYVTAGFWSQDRSDSLIVRDLSSGTETHYADYVRQEGHGGPIVFSPDCTELLYGTWVPLEFTLHRLLLGDGTSEPTLLPDAAHPQLFHWGASGIEVLAALGSSEFHVLRLTTGDSIQVGSFQYEYPDPGAYEVFSWWYHAWSNDGTRVAYWIGRCFDFESLFGDCSLARNGLFVADTRSGTRVRVAFTSGSGPIVFSPDGTRLVYHVSAGDFYVVDVP